MSQATIDNRTLLLALLRAGERDDIPSEALDHLAALADDPDAARDLLGDDYDRLVAEAGAEEEPTPEDPPPERVTKSHDPSPAGLAPLASWWAELFQALAESGQEIPDDLQADADDSLAGSGWAVGADESGEWQARKQDATVRKSWQSTVKASQRSPKGGISIGGVHYQGGRFIPGKALEHATHEEKEKLAQAKAGEEKTAEAKKQVRGSAAVDVPALSQRLSGYRDSHPVTGEAARAGKLAYAALRRHHGDLLVHRVGELAGLAEKALASLPDDHPNAEGLRDYWGRQLGVMSGWLERAGGEGYTGEAKGEKVVEAEPAQQAEEPKPTGSNTADIITTAAKEITGGRINVRVRLADLRKKVPDLSREEFDRALMDMERRGEVAIMPLDNPWEKTPADREAVLRTAAGSERHIVYFKQKPAKKEAKPEPVTETVEPEAGPVEVKSRGMEAILRDIRTAERQMGRIDRKTPGYDEKVAEIQSRIRALNAEKASLRTQRTRTPATPEPRPARGYDPGKSYAVDGKEPWAMTGAEWQAAMDRYRPSAPGGVGRVGPQVSARIGSDLKTQLERLAKLRMDLPDVEDESAGGGSGGKRGVGHREVVGAALAAGKPVPYEVAQDYPGLLEEANFTGTLTDSQGRTYRFVDGKRVAGGPDAEPVAEPATVDDTPEPPEPPVHGGPPLPRTPKNSLEAVNMILQEQYANHEHQYVPLADIAAVMGLRPEDALADLKQAYGERKLSLNRDWLGDVPDGGYEGLSVHVEPKGRQKWPTVATPGEINAISENVLDYLAENQPDSGTMYAIPAIRDAMNAPDRQAFDEAVWKLWRDKKVKLVTISNPQSRSLEELHRGMTGENGRGFLFYIEPVAAPDKSTESTSSSIDDSGKVGHTTPVEAKLPREEAMTTTKKPMWEMTREEFLQSPEFAAEKIDPTDKFKVERAHWFAVESALRKGETVPGDVLREVESWAAPFLAGKAAGSPPDVPTSLEVRSGRKTISVTVPATVTAFNSEVRRLGPTGVDELPDGKLRLRQAQRGPQAFQEYGPGTVIERGAVPLIVSKAGRPYKARHDDRILGYYQDVEVRPLTAEETAAYSRIQAGLRAHALRRDLLASQQGGGPVKTLADLERIKDEYAAALAEVRGYA